MVVIERSTKSREISTSTLKRVQVSIKLFFGCCLLPATRASQCSLSSDTFYEEQNVQANVLLLLSTTYYWDRDCSSQESQTLLGIEELVQIK